LANEYDIVVAGGGIAGLTAGLAGAKAGLSTFMLTGDLLGGNLLSIEKIDGFPGYPDGVAGYELCPITQGDAVQAGAELAPAELLSLEQKGDHWLVHTETEDYLTKTVILAMGASLRELDVPGAEKFKGKGVSHCASCDAPLLRDKNVVVVGGGDSALQEALTLAAAAARVIILQQDDHLTAQSYYTEQIDAEPKIEVRYNINVEEIIGTETVEGVKVRDQDNASSIVATDGAFIYIGLQPNTRSIDGLLKLDETGRILVDTEMRTEFPGLLSVGTVRAGSTGRARDAAADAVKAAEAATHYIADSAWQ
jgi:thioredoxin reductase (NADPH)